LAEQPGFEKAPVARVCGRQYPHSGPARVVGPYGVPVDDSEKRREYSYETVLFSSKGGSSACLCVGPAVGGRIAGHWPHRRRKQTVSLEFFLRQIGPFERSSSFRDTPRAGHEPIDIDSLLPNSKRRPSQLRTKTRSEAGWLKTGGGLRIPGPLPPFTRCRGIFGNLQSYWPELSLDPPTSYSSADGRGVRLVRTPPPQLGRSGPGDKIVAV
jgi:hypothetical protein